MKKSIAKKLSNPASMGGQGNIFETEIATAFVTLMLAGGFSPCSPSLKLWPICKIKFQGKSLGYSTDDLIVFSAHPESGREIKLLCQVKRSITVGDNKLFREVIQAAWSDFNNEKLFNKNLDSIAIISSNLSKTDIYSVREMLDWARHKESDEFFMEVNLGKYSSKTKKDKLNSLRDIIKSANNGIDVSDEDIWLFLRHFHLLGYDMDIKSGVVLSLFKSLIAQHSQDDANDLWLRIKDFVESYKPNGGSIQLSDIPEEIRYVFEPKGASKIPENLIIAPLNPQDWKSHEFVDELAAASLLGGWNE